MGQPFRIGRRIHFSETDMAGVMHFASYLEVMEEAEHAMWRSLGESVITVVDGKEYHWPRARVACDYFEPLRFEDEVELSLAIKKIGARSITFRVEFLVNGKQAAAAEATAVCCTMVDGRFTSTGIPQPIREKLTKFHCED